MYCLFTNLSSQIIFSFFFLESGKNLVCQLSLKAEVMVICGLRSKKSACLKICRFIFFVFGI